MNFIVSCAMIGFRQGWQSAPAALISFFYRYIYRYKDVHPESGTLSEMLFLYLKKEQEEINRKTNLLFI